MPNRALLNNVEHAGLKVRTGYGAAYGDAINQALIFPTEFEDIQREYPILFCKEHNGDALQVVALLGLDEDENLFLDGSDWRARYVPAVHARGPFTIALHKQPGGDAPEPMVHVDMDDPRVNEAEGAAAFLPQGGNSPYLEQVNECLRRIHRGADMVKPMFDAFGEAGLLAPVKLELMLSETEKYNIVDYFSISEEGLRGLDGARLEALNRQGFLQLAYLALSSLGNIRRLIELKNLKRQTG